MLFSVMLLQGNKPFTNINDMSKWVMNFYEHKLGDQKDIDQLMQNGKLNNGKEISYASAL